MESEADRFAMELLEIFSTEECFHPSYLIMSQVSEYLCTKY